MLAGSAELRHFWSPWMHLEIGRGPAVTSVAGRFSPHPSIWMAIMFANLVLAFLLFFAVMFAAAQWIAGRPPSFLYAAPLVAGIAWLIWGMSQVGQSLARQEMDTLLQTTRACLLTTDSPDSPFESAANADSAPPDPGIGYL